MKLQRFSSLGILSVLAILSDLHLHWFGLCAVVRQKRLLTSAPHVFSHAFNEIYDDDTEDLEDIKIAFENADTDKSGGLSLSEITEAISLVVNGDEKNNIIAIFHQYFPIYDVNNDSELNLQEIIEAHFKFGRIVSSLIPSS